MAQTVTALLVAWSSGDQAARDELIPLVYQELRRVAARQLRRERRGHSLQATALVHETYLKLVDQNRVRWQNRSHFFGVAATLMRRILVDHARRRGSQKKGGRLLRVALDVDLAASGCADVDMIVLDQALEELAAQDPGLSRVVELRYFGGLSIEETAALEGTSPSTVKRNWKVARAWLHNRIRGTEVSE